MHWLRAALCRSTRGRQRTYVNFGRMFTRDFSVTVSRRARPVLEKAGISLSSLTGKVVRVRGIVSGRLAPQIDADSRRKSRSSSDGAGGRIS